MRGLTGNNKIEHHQPLKPTNLEHHCQLLKPTKPLTLQTHQTHQSSRNNHIPNDEEDLRGHPFTYEIIDTPLPSKWKRLTIKLYDGSTDPDKHLNVVKTQMTLYTTNKTVWCKVFPTSLQEGPLDWFTGLPPNNVGNFKVLTTKFITQYTII